MPAPATFTCPSCAAPLSIEGNQAEVQCPFCGTRVIVPQELRAKTPPPPPAAPTAYQFTIKSEPVVYITPAAVTPPRKSSSGGCVGSVIILAVVAGILAAVFGIVSENSPSSGITAAISHALGAAGIGPNVVVSGEDGTGPGQFKVARRVAGDDSGNIFVSDLNTFRVQKFGLDGSYLLNWTVDQGKAELGPDSLQADKAGNVYVVEDGVILKYDGKGSKLLTKFTGQAGKTAYDGDKFADIEVMPDGTIWAMSQRSFSDDVVHLDSKGKILTRWSKAISSQLGSNSTVLAAFVRIAVNSQGEVFTLYSDARHPMVFKFSPEGQLVAKFGDGGDAPGKFDNALAIAIDGQDRVYVGDQHNLQVFDSGGRYLRNVGDSSSLGALDLWFDGKTTMYVLTYDTVTKVDVGSSSAS